MQNIGHLTGKELERSFNKLVFCLNVRQISEIFRENVKEESLMVIIHNLYMFFIEAVFGEVWLFVYSTALIMKTDLGYIGMDWISLKITLQKEEEY